jgi:hypothetical protein
MRRVTLVIMGVGLVLGTAGSSFAGAVNCKQVNKYLQTGRSVKDVAETMVIDESEVKKCQEQAGSDAAAGAAKDAEKKAGDMGKGMMK